MKLVILDYNMGNVGSIANMIKKIGYEAEITRDVERIRSASKLILPGVGAFDKAMSNIEEFNLLDLLKQKVTFERVPILGICLGMQIMTLKSEEGIKNGLGFINGEVKKFNFADDIKLKVPHMGWNFVHIEKENNLFAGMNEEAMYYFVHSYHTLCYEKADMLTTTNYGYDFVSSFTHGNVMGVQFHPEKSHKFGMKLLKNFIEKF